jgi:hypothetical protein
MCHRARPSSTGSTGDARAELNWRGASKNDFAAVGSAPNRSRSQSVRVHTVCFRGSVNPTCVRFWRFSRGKVSVWT